MSSGVFNHWSERRVEGQTAAGQIVCHDVTRVLLILPNRFDVHDRRTLLFKCARVENEPASLKLTTRLPTLGGHARLDQRGFVTASSDWQSSESRGLLK